VADPSRAYPPLPHSGGYRPWARTELHIGSFCAATISPPASPAPPPSPATGRTARR
jgi:hypothetical protein